MGLLERGGMDPLKDPPKFNEEPPTVFVALSHDCCGEPFCGIFATFDEAAREADQAVEEWSVGGVPRKVARWSCDRRDNSWKVSSE